MLQDVFSQRRVNRPTRLQFLVKSNHSAATFHVQPLISAATSRSSIQLNPPKRLHAVINARRIVSQNTLIREYFEIRFSRRSDFFARPQIDEKEREKQYTVNYTGGNTAERIKCTKSK